MSAPTWVETVLADHLEPWWRCLHSRSTWDPGHCSRCEEERAEVAGQLAAVLWAEFTARAQQAREDVAGAEARFGAAYPFHSADAAIAALLTAIGGAA